jgi:hypothetical protein
MWRRKDGVGMIEWRENNFDVYGTTYISSFETNIGGVRMAIIPNYYSNPPTWAVISLPFFDWEPLSASSLDQAKQEAIALLKAKIEPVFMELMKET